MYPESANGAGGVWVVVVSGRRTLNVKQEVADISVLHNVRFPFDSQLSCGSNVLFGLVGFKIRQGIDFTANEAAFKIGVNHTSSLRRGGSDGNCPRPDFFFAGGEVALQAQSFVRRTSEWSESRLLQPDRFQHLLTIGFIEFR